MTAPTTTLANIPAMRVIQLTITGKEPPAAYLYAAQARAACGIYKHHPRQDVKNALEAVIAAHQHANEYTDIPLTLSAYGLACLEARWSGKPWRMGKAGVASLFASLAMEADQINQKCGCSLEDEIAWCIDWTARAFSAAPDEELKSFNTGMTMHELALTALISIAKKIAQIKEVDASLVSPRLKNEQSDPTKPAPIKTLSAAAALLFQGLTYTHEKGAQH